LRAYDRATGAIDSPDARTSVEDRALGEAVTEAREDFSAALDDDFDTRGGQAALLDLAGAVNRHLDAGNEYDYRGLRRAVDAFKEFGEAVLGLDFSAGGGRIEGKVSLADDLIELVVESRERAREAGEYDRADALREELRELGVEIEDTGEGTEYRY
jgi:cysteinyl-tRNA synthetase